MPFGLLFIRPLGIVDHGHKPVFDVVIRKVNEKEITNSKDIRKLRQILKDPVAKQEFLSPTGSVDTAQEKLGPAPARKRTHGLFGDVELTDSLRHYSWTELAELKGDAQLLRKIEEAEKLLKDLKKALGR